MVWIEGIGEWKDTEGKLSLFPIVALPVPLFSFTSLITKLKGHKDEEHEGSTSMFKEVCTASVLQLPGAKKLN